MKWRTAGVRAILHNLKPDLVYDQLNPELDGRLAIAVHTVPIKIHHNKARSRIQGAKRHARARGFDVYVICPRN
jgi:hypothetical protein